MRCIILCSPVGRYVYILYKKVKMIRDRGVFWTDCWECLNIIFTWFRLIKCVKFLRDCLKFKNKPEYQYRRLSSIKIDRDETGETVHRLREEIEHKDNKIHELQEQNRKTALDKRHAEVEKQEALTRLSELMSVKLRDNNPNIADLNDPFRPTKLAEMFSELYDNEWTALYTVLEDSSKFKDRHMINFLLDVFMVSFTFCKTELEANWQLVSKWYLDDNVPNNQAVKKTLKDRRKLFVPRVLPEMENKLYTLLCGLCKLESLQFVLSSCQMKEYVATCVKLSLLMNANDPPVAIECPGWVPCISQKESIYQPKHEEESDLLTHEGNAQIPTNVDGDGSNQTYTSDLKERRTFNKELFKEYTVRGKYVEFFVWPVMYLHENGPVLAKGIAQGAEDKVISDDDHRWVWW
ncbi:uncharacterized protein LOC128225830 [Mya arenaria]|uniref:uncharacterized protein LOC128225830 n=1 Tax=Mya arenaria TaxID=6604 RepID=UPI0022E573DF|nr:uncharacterized protein LOC128225830 [Mya arenaria]